MPALFSFPGQSLSTHICVWAFVSGDISPETTASLLFFWRAAKGRTSGEMTSIKTVERKLPRIPFLFPCALQPLHHIGGKVLGHLWLFPFSLHTASHGPQVSIQLALFCHPRWFLNLYFRKPVVASMSKRKCCCSGVIPRKDIAKGVVWTS